MNRSTAVALIVIALVVIMNIFGYLLHWPIHGMTW
jgi:hypothetical protein